MLFQISSGRGPIECELAVCMYSDWLRKQNKGMTIESFQPLSSYKTFLSYVPYKSITVKISSGYYPRIGIIKWVCESPVRENCKRKNWFIQVSKLDRSEFLDTKINTNDLRVDFFRCGGPGGQKVNKTSTGVRLTHVPTGFIGQSETERTQVANRVLAFERLKKAMIDYNNEQELKNKIVNWSEHNSLERGNPVEIFEGINFVRRGNYET